MTHRDLCRDAARWLLDQRWCHAAGYEIRGGGGVLDAVGVSSPVDEIAGDAEYDERDRVEAAWRLAHDRWIAAGCQGEPPAVAPGTSPVPMSDRLGRPRIVVVEVKRTRRDLLADLRAGKMLRCQLDGSACYLMLDAEIAMPLEELAALGLPEFWGVLAFHDAPLVVRRAKLHREVTVGQVRMWTYRIGRSLSYRVVGGGPMADEEAE